VNFQDACETSPIGSRYHKSAGICAAHEKWGLGFVEVYLPQVLLVALLSLAEVGCLIWNNLYSMSNDSRTSKDVAVSGNENAYNSFLPRDTTLDELIASGSRFVTAVDLWALSLLTHRLIRKLELVDPRRYPGLDQAVHATVLLLKSPQAQAAIDPLPRHLAEVGFAAHYFLKESDLIPDKTPEVGLADDFAIFKQVFARNRLEIDNVIYKS
jgi:Protein of unknown function (DUF1232)